MSHGIIMLPDESGVQVAGSSTPTRHERLLPSKRRSGSLSQNEHDSSHHSIASSRIMRCLTAKCLHIEGCIMSLSISHLRD